MGSILDFNEEIIDRPVHWNQERENMEFCLEREIKMLVEEVYELCGYSRVDSKIKSASFIHENRSQIEKSSKNLNIDATLDAAGDLLFIASGTIGKLKYIPSEILRTICDHNDQKGSKKDKDGKIIKDTNVFVEPQHIKSKVK